MLYLSKKQGNKVKYHYQSSVPSHLQNVEFRDGMGLSFLSRQFSRDLAQATQTVCQGRELGKITFMIIYIPCT